MHDLLGQDGDGSQRTDPLDALGTQAPPVSSTRLDHGGLFHTYISMTSRYALTSPLEVLQRVFHFDGGMPYPPRVNIAPTQPVAIVRLRPGVRGER